MTKKRITDDAPDGDQTNGAQVNRSRRRFTGAALSTSAILTLASRPAFSQQCTNSSTASGDASKANAAVVQCVGNMPSVYLDKNMWPSGFEAGKPNPIAPVQPSYLYPTFAELDDAIKSTPAGALQDACIDYQLWAYPTGGASPTPSPTDPMPHTFDSEFAGTGLTAADPTMTLMQALEQYGDSVMGHAVAALFNCYVFPRDNFGYDPDELKTFIAESDPIELLTALQQLNSR